MTKWKDPGTGLEVILQFNVVDKKYQYFFRDADGQETEPIVISLDQFHSIAPQISEAQKESYFGMNLLRDEVNRRREAKLKETPPLERAQKILTEKWPWAEQERIIAVLSCIVEHLIAIDKPK